MSIDEKIDVGCMWDTLEHLREPQLYIKKFSEALSKGGILAMTTGDIGSFLARFRKESWRLIHPPTHIHYFNRSSLVALLNKYGFHVIHFEYCGFYRSFSNVLYNILVLRNKRSHLYNMLNRINFDFFFYLNTRDIMYIIAEKI